MGTIGEFKVDFELYNIAEVMKQMDDYDKGMKEAIKQTQKTEKEIKKSTSSWSKGFLDLKLVVVAAMSTIYYQVMKTSPAIQAHLGSIGIAIDLVGMTIGEAISPLFQVFEDMSWAFAEWFMDLDEGTQKAIGYAIAVVGIVAAVSKLAGLKWGLLAGGVVLLAIAYAENFGNMQTNVNELWRNIKDKDWAKAWDTLKITVKDLWNEILPHWEAFRDSLFTWAEAETWGEFAKIVMNKIKTKFMTIWTDYVKPQYEKLRDKIFEWAGAENWGEVAINIMEDMWKETEGLRNVIISATKWMGGAIWQGIKDGLKEWMTGRKEEKARKFGAPEGTMTGTPLDVNWTMMGAGIANWIGGKQAGGYVASTGMYMMHAGERVIPSGGTSGGIGTGVNVTNNNIFYGNMGDRHTMTQNVNDMTQTMKTSLKQFQSTALGGRF